MYFKKSTLVVGIVLLVAVTVVLTIGALNPFGLRNLDDFIQFSYVTRLVNQHYLKEPNREDLMSGAIAGMVEEIQDPYSTYVWGEEAEAYLEKVNGSFCGIGVTIENHTEDDTIQVVNTIPGGPAEKAGIQAGDKILMIDGKPVYGKNIGEAQSLIRGELGTEVVVTIRRVKDGETIDLSLTRQEIALPSVTGGMVTDSVGRITLSQFVRGSAESFSKTFDELKKEGMKSLIIDLRNNPGGLLDEVIEISGLFVEEGKLIVYTEDRYGKRNNWYSQGKGEQIPIVILTNRNSASASEVLTGALKDYGLAYQIGETTYGKGVVQGVFLTGMDEVMTLTVSQYFTPKGVSIHEKGIKPDLEIEMDETKYRRLDSLSMEEDEQLQAALEYLNR